MAQPTTCHRCGQEIRWVNAYGEKFALDATPQLGGKYRLVGEDASKAELTDHKGQSGYMPHKETCPARVRERERF